MHTHDPLKENRTPRYGELNRADYAALGLMVGLEVHQQLKTTRKLFCRCPAGHRFNSHDAEILRHMRPTLSEMGEYDGTALMEFKTRKEIIYRIRRETVCTYEMDDAPPFEIDDDALDVALQISALLGLRLVDELHIARKQYLDGSIPAGFQRTGILGIDGAIPFKEGRVGVRQLSIEEDSCREVSDEGHTRIYRADRLGTPLIEVVTEPDMRTPQDGAAVAQLIRDLVRATGRVRTHAGGARQDVNVSVRGGVRNEIKGVDSYKLMPELIHNEALRQANLLHVRSLLQARGAIAPTAPGVEVTAQLRQTPCDFLREAIHGGAAVHAVALPGFEGLLSHPIQPGVTFLKEIADRVRVIACLDHRPNLICSEDSGPNISSGEWGRVRRALGAKRAEPILLVWGPERDCRTATQEVLNRAAEALIGVPSETRQAFADGTTGFERILPGPERMYPDTDLPPITITPARIARLKAGLPEPPWARRERLLSVGVGLDLAERLIRHAAYDLFWALYDERGEAISAQGLASLLLDRRCDNPAEISALSWWRAQLDALHAGRIIPETLWMKGEVSPEALDEAAARDLFEALLGSAPAPLNLEAEEAALMGALMNSPLRGRARGRLIRQWLRQALEAR
ncbi:Glu-tRNA(Gln) amidotransferase subunit GatE [Myxococcota bacterium]|nr:Glu-tRNA(Gln) amidotransferase subunit GatE [Myxococcota bacterium]